ncbi:hypothetical protein EDF46_1119 [Frondihabitans sp. PhB188]|uniref:hypothetical protein n=1 Tax=Frondihabitans sp. PhB188 TaxID=2485200 RepID=UPI000F48FC97|nr:hypothetical protein [Frondihabitans sp. PhB188]ROQ39487.1 hypothetical protein EDF46_1119 [Frondihabitans sp. PhB188]
MTSSYSSDPRVPPVRVEHLGKHHRSTPHGPVGLPTAAPAPDPGPSYEDFLEPDDTGGEVPDRTG